MVYSKCGARGGSLWTDVRVGFLHGGDSPTVFYLEMDIQSASRAVGAFGEQTGPITK